MTVENGIEVLELDSTKNGVLLVHQLDVDVPATDGGHVGGSIEKVGPEVAVFPGTVDIPISMEVDLFPGYTVEGVEGIKRFLYRWGNSARGNPTIKKKND